jgi:hypothetical protein
MTNETQLPASVAAYMTKVREELTASRLGHLGRRIEMLAEMANESALTYGSKSLVGNLAGHEVSVPVKTTVSMVVTIEAGSATKTYAFAVGANHTAPPATRPETPLAEFHSTVTSTATVSNGTVRTITV